MDAIRFLLAKRTDITHGDLPHCAAQGENKPRDDEIAYGK